MNKLRRKWSGQGGASLVLALLFLLVCMMAAASVLMAAASNMGKIRSNQQEQQRYLTLSSALQLVCDELNRAEYTGRYHCDAVPVPETDGDGNLTGAVDHTIYTLRQRDGKLQFGLAGGGSGEVLPLDGELDKLAGNNFQIKAVSPGDVILPFVPLDVPPGRLGPHTVTLSVNVPDSSRENYPAGLLAEVAVTVRVDTGSGPRAGVISLAAELNETNESGSTISMRAEAELKPEHHPGDVFAISSLEAGDAETGVLKWTLDWIKKAE